MRSSTYDVCFIEEGQEDGIDEEAMTQLLPSLRAKNSCVVASWNSDGACYLDSYLRGKEPPERLELRYCDVSDNPHAYRATRLMSEARRTLRKSRADDNNLARFRWVWKGHDRDRNATAAVRNWKIGTPDIPDHAINMSQPAAGLDYSNSPGSEAADPHHLVVGNMWHPVHLYGDSYDPEKHKPTLYITREWMGRCGTAALAGHIRRTIGPVPEGMRILADSANGGLTDDLSAHPHDLPVEGAKKGKGSVEAGLNALSDDFDFWVDPGCKHLIGHLQSYRWNEKGKLIGTRHGPDACRYLIQSYDPTAADLSGVAWIHLQHQQQAALYDALEFMDDD